MVVWWKDGRWLGEEGVNSHHFQKTELNPRYVCGARVLSFFLDGKPCAEDQNLAPDSSVAAAGFGTGNTI